MKRSDRSRDDLVAWIDAVDAVLAEAVLVIAALHCDVAPLSARAGIWVELVSLQARLREARRTALAPPSSVP